MSSFGRRLLLSSVCLLALVTAAPAAAQVVVSEVYGGGGNAGATLTHDYIELFNRGTTDVDLAGWSVQYGSATGNIGTGDTSITPLSGSIAAGQYVLIQEAQGAGGTVSLSPDITDLTPIAMSGTAGKVALVNTTAGLNCGATGATPDPCTPAELATIVDLVGYGTTATFFEGTGPTPAPSNSTSVTRAGGGCTDTNTNATDFTAGPTNPQNRMSLPAPCAATPADSAPTVSSTSPASGAAGVPVGSNITITFSEPVNDPANAFAISCATTGTHPFAVTGASTTFTLNPDADFGAGETCTVTVTGTQVTDQDTNDPPDTMAANYQFSFTTATPAIEIHQVQGATHVSPYVGQTVTLQPGVVTAVRANGFFLQDPTPDANIATSDAIFVFTSSTPRVLQGETLRPIVAGDKLTVTGTVTEFRGGGATSPNLTLTQITSPTIALTDADLPAVSVTVIGIGGRTPPTNVIDDDANGSVETGGSFDPTTDGIDFYESLEAMLVRIHDAVVVGPTNSFGELWVLPDNGANASLRTARGGIVVRPGDFNPERIQLDDVIADTPDANVNDRIPGPTTGVLNYDFGNFELLITSPAVAVPGGITREVTATPGPFELSVATFNVENLHPGNPASKFNDLAALIVNNLKSPDVIGLEEVQDNNGPTNDAVTDANVTLTMLADAIVAAGGPRYDFRQINPVDDQDGGQPGGNIRVAFLYRTDRGVEFVDRAGGGSTTATGVVAAPGGGAQLTASPGRVAPTNAAWESSRKPLVGEFLFRSERFFVSVNHFNSKGGDQPLFGRNQPPTLTTETQRRQQAQVLRDFFDQILAIDPNANIIALGDFNDFEFSRPLEILKGTTLHDLIETLPPNERYGYVFEGNSQTLDHILVSSNIFQNTPFVYDVVHVNAEFADQTSDHDPSVVRLLDQSRVGLTKTASADAVSIGGVVSYTLRVVNNGPKPATNVVLTDPLPAGAQFLSVTPSQGTCQVTTTITCSLGTLANRATATVTIEVRTTQQGALTNTAAVDAAQPDPNAADDQSTATTTVGPPPVVPPARTCRVNATPSSLVAGRRAVIRIAVDLLGPREPQGDVLVRLQGSGIQKTARTGDSGLAKVTVRASRAGTLRVTAPGRSECAADTIRVRKAPRSGTAGAGAGLTGRP